jgi:hypothetical protein
VPHNYVKETHGRSKYELYDYNWSEDYPALRANSWPEAVEMAKVISEGCLYTNDIKTHEIMDGKLEKIQDYEPEFYYNP